MKKCWLALMFILLCGAALVGCKPKENVNGTLEEIPQETSDEEKNFETEDQPDEESAEAETVFELALITDGRTVASGMLNQTAFAGMVAYAEENRISHRYYRPVDDEHGVDYRSAIEEAVENQASVVVCIGADAEADLLEMQTVYPDVSFVLLDGEPRTEDGTMLESNAMAVRFQIDQGAYLAGYAAAVSGQTKVGCIGYKNDTNAKRYCYGFLQGLNDGAEQVEAQKEETAEEPVVEMYYTYLESEPTGEDLKNLLTEWKEFGVQSVLASAESLSTACAKQGNAINMQVITSECVISDSYPNVVASIAIDASVCVYEICEQYYEERFDGGAINFYDMSTDSVVLKLGSAPFAQFSQAECDALHDALANGDIQINNDTSVPITVLEYPFVTAHIR